MADTHVDVLNSWHPLGLSPICVAPDGDVILEHRAFPRSRPFQFRVASQILCVASPYFRDMPGPESTFKRACDLRGGVESNPEPWIIATWGGNPNALEILLYALHFRSEKVPDTVSFDQLWKLAVLCDKYDCVSAMKPWISLWIREPPQHKDNFAECLAKWVYMARIFGRDDLFEKVTREIILEGRYYGRIPSDDHFAMPSCVSLSDPRFLIPESIICRLISSTNPSQLKLPNCISPYPEAPGQDVQGHYRRRDGNQKEIRNPLSSPLQVWLGEMRHRTQGFHGN